MAENPYSGTASTSPSVQQPDDYQKIDANPNQFGGEIAQGLQQFGAGATQASKFYSQVASDDATNGAMKGINDTMNKYLTLQGADAMSARQGTMDSINEIVKQGRDSLMTPQSQLEYDNATRSFVDRLVNGKIQSHADEQFKTYQSKVNNDGVTTAMNLIASDPNNEQTFNDNLHQARMYAVKGVQAQGNESDPKIVQAAIDGADQASWKTRIEAKAANGDAAGALAMATANKSVLGEDYPAVYNQLRARADQQSGDNLGRNVLSGAQQNVLRSAAPGATGYGLINAPYTAPLDQPGEKGIVSPAQHYSYLTSIGASKNEALLLTGAAASESSFNATAVHDNGNGYGLYGHNLQRMDLRWHSWQDQASSALAELRSRPESAMVNSATTPEQLALAEMHYEQPRGYRSSNPQAGDNYTGRLNTIRYFSQMADGQFSGSQGAPLRGGLVRSQGNGSSFAHAFGQGLQPVLDADMPAPNAQPAASTNPPPNLTFPDSAPQQPNLPPVVSRADAYQQINAAEENGTASHEVAQRARTFVTQELAAQQVAYESDERAKKQASDTSANGYVSRMLKGQNTGNIVNEIASDQSLTWETKRSLGDAAVRDSAEGSDPRKYGSGFWDAYKGIIAPEGDPRRISDPADLLKRAGPGGDLTLAGAEKLISLQAQSRKSVNDDAVVKSKAALIDYAKSQLSFDQEMSFPGGKPYSDPKGAAIFNSQFIPQFEASYDSWIQEGKSPWEFLKRDNVDKMIAGMRPKAQMQMDKLLASQGLPGAQTGAPPAPANVDKDEWANMANIAPVVGGQPVPETKWAAMLTRLTSNPTPDEIATFNRSEIARAGFDAQAILDKLKVKQIPNHLPQAVPAEPVAPPAPAQRRSFGQWLKDYGDYKDEEGKKEVQGPTRSTGQKIGQVIENYGNGQ